MILSKDLKSSLGLNHYQSFTQKEKILSINMRLSPVVIIHTRADDSINETEIITRFISLSIIHTGADDSINECEIVIMLITTVQWLFQ